MDLKNTFQRFIKGDRSAVMSVEGGVGPRHRHALSSGILHVKVCLQHYIMTALGLTVSWVFISVIIGSYLIQAMSLVTGELSTVCW